MRTQRIFFLLPIRREVSTISPSKQKKKIASSPSFRTKYLIVNNRLHERTKECDQLRNVINEKNQEIGCLHQTIILVKKITDDLKHQFGDSRSHPIFMVMEIKMVINFFSNLWTNFGDITTSELVL